MNEKGKVTGPAQHRRVCLVTNQRIFVRDGRKGSEFKPYEKGKHLITWAYWLMVRPAEKISWEHTLEIRVYHAHAWKIYHGEI